MGGSGNGGWGVAEERWEEIGAAAELARTPLVQLTIGRTKIALILRDGAFGAISGVCNHVGGPLGEGRLDGDYVVCPWHDWKFHWRDRRRASRASRRTAFPGYAMRVEDGRVLVDVEPAHAAHAHAARAASAGAQARARRAGRSAWSGSRPPPWTPPIPRYSTSDALLEHALEHAARRRSGCETRLHPPAASSSSAPARATTRRARSACTWPCSITQMDPERPARSRLRGDRALGRRDPGRDADPLGLRPSSLYYKMVERMNCIQNQITIAQPRADARQGRGVHHHRRPGQRAGGGRADARRSSPSSAVIFPPFPFIAHSRGWSAEDMENNVAYVQEERRAARRRRRPGRARRRAVEDAARRGAGRGAHRPRRPQGAPARRQGADMNRRRVE